MGNNEKNSFILVKCTIVLFCCYILWSDRPVENRWVHGDLSGKTLFDIKGISHYGQGLED